MIQTRPGDEQPSVRRTNTYTRAPLGIREAAA